MITSLEADQKSLYIEAAKKALQSELAGAPEPMSADGNFSTTPSVAEVDFEKELDRRQREQQIDQEQWRFEAEMEEKQIDRDMKQSIAKTIFQFLAVETVGVFIILAMQGLRPFNFQVQDSTLNIFLGATILQISAMAVMVIRHLFPTK